MILALTFFQAFITIAFVLFTLHSLKQWEQSDEEWRKIATAQLNLLHDAERIIDQAQHTINLMDSEVQKMRLERDELRNRIDDLQAKYATKKGR